MTTITKEMVNQFQSKQLSSATRKNYGLVIKNFLSWSGGVLPDDERWPHKYQSHMIGQKKSNKTINYYMVIVGAFYRHLTGKKLAYDRFKEKRKTVELLTDKDIEELILGARTEFKPVIQFLSQTGMRVGELASLSEDCDTESIKKRQFIFIGKGGVQRQVWITEGLRDTLLGLAKDKFIFGRPWKIWQIQQELKMAAENAGLGKRVHPHMLRHTMATRFLRNGANILQVQRMLGHKNLATTQIYTHVSDEWVEQAWATQRD